MLCLQVGPSMEKSVIDMPTEEFDRVHNVNARGNFFVTGAVSKVMLQQQENFAEGRSGRRSIGRGSLINISSLNGQIPVSNHVQYGSSKYATLGITLTAGKCDDWLG